MTDERIIRTEADALRVWGAAFGVSTASVARLTATAKQLVWDWKADAERCRRAEGFCRARLAEERTPGWNDAIVLLAEASAQIRDGGAVSPGAFREAYLSLLRAELFPDPEPFRWPSQRREDPAWVARRRELIAGARLRWSSATGRGIRVLEVLVDGELVGLAKYEVCDACRLGYVGRIDIYGDYKGYGLGSLLVDALYRRCPGHRWYTTAQFPTAGTFWEHVAERTGGGFPELSAPPCRHITFKAAS